MIADLTLLRRAPTIYVDFNASCDPLITDDMGYLAPVCFGQLSTFVNDEFESVPAAMEYYGVPSGGIPALTSGGC